MFCFVDWLVSFFLGLELETFATSRFLFKNVDRAARSQRKLEHMELILTLSNYVTLFVTVTWQESQVYVCCCLWSTQFKYPIYTWKTTGIFHHLQLLFFVNLCAVLIFDRLFVYMLIYRIKKCHLMFAFSAETINNGLLNDVHLCFN